jgi:hypothetical protein
MRLPAVRTDRPLARQLVEGQLAAGHGRELGTPQADIGKQAVVQAQERAHIRSARGPSSSSHPDQPPSKKRHRKTPQKIQLRLSGTVKNHTRVSGRSMVGIGGGVARPQEPAMLHCNTI